MKFTADEMVDILIMYVGVHEETVNALTGIISGSDEKILTDALYYFTGYNDFWTFLVDEGYEEDFAEEMDGE